MEKKQYESIRNQRRPKGIVNPVSINFIHLRQPWVIAWWSASYLGYAYMSLGSYIKGFILIFLEALINVNSKLNLGILYSLTGRFELAKQTVDMNWLLFYVPIYIFSIWGANQLAVALNKYSILADREDSTMIPFGISGSDFAFLDKRKPWMAVALSLLAPGLGHLYTHRIPTSFYTLMWWMIIAYMGHLFQCIHLTAIGDFAGAIAIADPEWLIFLPSIYSFSIYDSYVNTVEYNRLFDQEQQRFIIDNYQSLKFPMPT
ncbi:MAG TPA: hypothetical protein VN426_08645 [Syntrophomonadaceae bacterium]|nr:hypothetical protein [Syntrophomonadaceae bacterium]